MSNTPLPQKLTSLPYQLLVLNSGSSSLKFALYVIGDREELWLSGKLTRIGLTDGHFTRTVGAHQTQMIHCNLPDHTTALTVLFDWLHEQPDLRLNAVGHRLVHGGSLYKTPQPVTPRLIADLRLLIPFAPDHLPAEIGLIEAIGGLYPDLLQVACFDTAFHQTMPEVAKRLPIPRHLADEGVARYGFHGLSYEYVMSQLAEKAGWATANGRLLLAHLGNGASMTAVRQGESIDTTMGFTPAGGLMMGTRSGDLDPGVLLYLLAHGYADAAALSHLLNDESGLTGVSDISSDMEELLEQVPHSPHAAEAIDLFCYLARKQLGGLIMVLNGLDTLVFTGGIGENSPAIRAAICKNLDFFGIVIDPQRNEANAEIISPEGHKPEVRVIPTNEERIIACHTRQVLMATTQPVSEPMVTN